MSRRPSFSIPLVALVVAAALALSSVGTATAAGITSAKVKKIATKVVKKQAKNLAVKHAATADNATNATNATNLGGAAPSAYRSRVMYAVGGTSDTDSPVFGVTTAGPVSITVPAGQRYLHLSGSVSFSGAAGDATAFWALDDVCDGENTGFDVDNSFGFLTNAAQSVTVPVDKVFEVVPGTYELRMCGISGTGINAFRSTLTVQTVAANGVGQ